jgi:polyhydroxyalkanoate synthesis regulator phasin
VIDIQIFRNYSDSYQENNRPTNAVIRKESVMKELLKSVVYTGIGAAFLTKEKIEELKDDFVKQGKIGQDEGKRFVDELIQKTEAVKDSLDLKITQIVEAKIKQLNIVTTDDFSDLRRQVEELQIALNKDPDV